MTTTSASTARDPAPASRHDDIACVAAAVIVAVLVFKATSTFDPLPGWSGDPTLVAAPILAMTPTPSIIADLILCLASATAIALALPRLASANRVLAAIASLAILFLAIAAPYARSALHDPHLAFTITAWQSALAAGVAAFALRAFPRARAILAAGALALLAAFFTRALVQYFIEQPAAYATFKATKSSFLAAQGWAEGSPNALAYERRVSQQEASAWFGMANVLASYGAAFAACFATWTIGALTNRANPASPRARFTLIACTLASAALVAMAGSKGGYAALLLGLALAALAAWRSARASEPSRRLQRASLLLAPGLIAFALAAIILRGVLGERIHELSLLFRWHYLVGAVRTFLEHPLFGVSPTGFKDAYLRLKPPNSPEDVASPHNVLLDLITGLGVAGVAWALIAVLAAALASRTLLAPRAIPDPIQPREREPLAATAGARPTFLALAAGTLAAAWLESAAVTPEAALVRIIAILGGMSIAGLALRSFERAPRNFSAGLAVAAVVALVHAQIELTWALLTSAPLLAVLVGVGAGAAPRDEHAPAPSRQTSRLSAIPGVIPVALVAIFIPNVVTWELSLRRAYADVAPLGTLSDRLQALAAATRSRDPVARDIASDLGKDLLPAAQANASFTFNDLTAAYAKLRLDRMSSAIDHMEPARRAWADFETSRAISTLSLRLALERQQAGDATGAEAATFEAIFLAAAALGANPNSAAAASWLATVQRTLALAPTPLTSKATLAEHRANEILWLQKAAELAPYEPSHPAWLAEAYAAHGDPAAAATWAEEALRRDALLYLDPIRQFDPARRARMESLAKGTAAPAAPTPP